MTNMINSNAKPYDYAVISKHARRLQSLIAVCLGAVLALLIQSQITKAEVIDPRMETACKFPRGDGEMTVITVIDGKLTCWRWR